MVRNMRLLPDLTIWVHSDTHSPHQSATGGRADVNIYIYIYLLTIQTAHTQYRHAISVKENGQDNTERGQRAHRACLRVRVVKVNATAFMRKLVLAGSPSTITEPHTQTSKCKAG